LYLNCFNLKEQKEGIRERGGKEIKVQALIIRNEETSY
jgi:hypothetical protein